MSSVWRIALTWLLALAVPVQGYAAVAMLGCGPGHHGMAATATADAPAHDHAAAGPMHRHEASAAPTSTHSHQDSAEADHDHVREAHATPGKLGKGACPTCASCCVVAGLPAALPQFQPVSLVDSFVRSAPAGATSFLVDGPERPPRHFLS